MNCLSRDPKCNMLRKGRRSNGCWTSFFKKKENTYVLSFSHCILMWVIWKWTEWTCFSFRYVPELRKHFVWPNPIYKSPLNDAAVLSQFLLHPLWRFWLLEELTVWVHSVRCEGTFVPMHQDKLLWSLAEVYMDPGRCICVLLPILPSSWAWSTLFISHHDPILSTPALPLSYSTLYKGFPTLVSLCQSTTMRFMSVLQQLTSVEHTLCRLEAH